MAKTISEMKYGPATLRKACDDVHPEEVLASGKMTIAPDGRETSSVGKLDVVSGLIEQVGRFVERYQSDMIFTINDIEVFLEPETDGEEHRWVIGAGLRESGVDHNAFIMKRLNDTRGGLYDFVMPEHVYRKVLAVDIQDAKDDNGYITRTLELKDVTHRILRIDPEDEDGEYIS